MPSHARDRPLRHRSAPRSVLAPFALALAVVVALGTWLFWPTLELGLFADDYFLAAAMDGELAAPRDALDLFNFVDGTQPDVQALQRLGSIAWWAAPDLRVSFLRPLSSALMHMDRALFGRALWAYHAHSIFAWSLLVVAAGVLYLRVLRSWPVAALATAFFAFDQSQHGPVFWICNRGAIYAVLLGVLGLAAHVRARSPGRHRSSWPSALLLGTALLFGEWALPMFAYVLAFELLGARGSLRRRALAVLPAATLGCVFLIVRALMGYGARASGVYVDPGSDPLGFARLLLHRIPVFVADMVFNLPSDLWDRGSPWRERVLALELIPPSVWMQLPDWRTYHVAIGIAALAVLWALLRFCLRGCAQSERIQLRWLLLGALLSLVPVAGAFPSTRLTLAASFGLAPALALALRQIARRLYEAPRMRWPRFLALYTVGISVLFLQLVEPLSEDVRATVDNFATTTEWVLAAELDPQRVADQRVFLLNASEFTTTFFFAYTWWWHDRPLPRSYTPISTAPYAHDLERIGDNALVLRTLGGSFFESPSEVHFRTADRQLRAGDAVQLEGVRIEIARAIAGRPRALKLTFDRPVDDPSYAFLVSSEHGLARLEMPAVGQTLRLRRASGPSWFALDRARHTQRIGPLPEVLDFAPAPPFVTYEP